ncbi:PucR family transcriptional regulator ligand-binding domain-containing protein, partial [Nonomuraea sp. K274]|nr:PucR family transcriptional regulator ligand-binding domain-containing protein [Nonomuraea cypriaca]
MGLRPLAGTSACRPSSAPGASGPSASGPGAFGPTASGGAGAAAVGSTGSRSVKESRGMDAIVRWVAVSELADPTPYLEGGELLLTTGLRMEGDLSGYVARLVARGVAGLGFGVGVSHEEVPPALIEAADQAGLPLLEVPRETPFIAIGKVVSELLAAEQYEEITRAFAAQSRMTRAALRPEGAYAVIDRLAKEVDGWAALLDETGEVRHATRGARTDVVSAELTRPEGVGHEGGVRSRGGERFPASLALSGPGEHIVVQPLGGGARPRGFFAVGARHAFSPVAHTVINAAGSLLTLSMEQGRAHLEAERRVRSAVLELLLSGAEEQARAVLEPLGGGLPGEPLVVLATGPEALDALEPHAFTALHVPAEHPHPTGPTPPVALALVPATTPAPEKAPEKAALEVAEKVALEADIPVGVSLPSGYGAAPLRIAIDQASRALETARRTHADRVPESGRAGRALEGAESGWAGSALETAGRGRVV